MFVLLPLGGDGIKTGKDGKTASLTQYTENMQIVFMVFYGFMGGYVLELFLLFLKLTFKLAACFQSLC